MKALRPIHAGEILREEFLKPLNMSASALATAIEVTPARINEIIREHRGITADIALRLSKYFGTTPEFWLNLQQHYGLAVAWQSETTQRAIEHISPYAYE